MGNKYGINVKKWCKLHESEVEALLRSDPGKDELCLMLDKHKKKLNWLMHERFIHLVVLLMTVVIVLFSIALLACAPDTTPAALPLCIIVLVLICFYVYHYFILENTVQRWYSIDEELTDRINSMP